MAITTLDGAIAGMKPPVMYTKSVSATLVAGMPFSFWLSAGSPSSGILSTALGGTALTSTATQRQGQIYHSNPGSGNAYLARFSGASLQGGILMLCDRLLDVGVTSTGPMLLTVAAASSVLSTGILARDANGSSAGVGVQLGYEVTTVLSGGGGTLSASYTNSTGTAAHTAVTLSTISATAPVGSFFFTGLAAGDIGVQSVQTITPSTGFTSGFVSAVLFRPLAMLELTAANIPNAVDALTAGFPQLYNGSVPFLIFVPNTTTATTIMGSMVETQG
jgi:hypothetical protein